MLIIFKNSLIEANRAVFPVQKGPIRECSYETEASALEELAGSDIVFMDIGIELMQVEHMLCILAHQSQCLAPIPPTTTFAIDYNAHLGTMVYGAEVKEVDDTHHSPAIHALHHQAQLLVHIQIVCIGLNVLLQLKTRIGDLTCRHQPLTSIVLYMKEIVEVGQLGSSKV